MTAMKTTPIPPKQSHTMKNDELRLTPQLKALYLSFVAEHYQPLADEASRPGESDERFRADRIQSPNRSINAFSCGSIYRIRLDEFALPALRQAAIGVVTAARVGPAVTASARLRWRRAPIWPSHRG